MKWRALRETNKQTDGQTDKGVWVREGRSESPFIRYITQQQEVEEASQ